MERRQEVRNGLKDGIAIGMGYFSVSFAFGHAGGFRWHFTVDCGIDVAYQYDQRRAIRFFTVIVQKRFADRISLDPACHQFALCANVAFFITEIRS